MSLNEFKKPNKRIVMNSNSNKIAIVHTIICLIRAITSTPPTESMHRVTF